LPCGAIDVDFVTLRIPGLSKSQDRQKNPPPEWRADFIWGIETLD